MVARLKRTALHEARHERRALADRGRTAEEDALLATEDLALALGQRGYVDVAHTRLDMAKHLGEHCVLHRRAFADQRDFLHALDRLDAVDEVGRVDEPGVAAERAVDTFDQRMRQRPRADEADGAIAALVENVG